MSGGGSARELRSPSAATLGTYNREPREERGYMPAAQRVPAERGPLEPARVEREAPHAAQFPARQPGPRAAREDARNGLVRDPRRPSASPLQRDRETSALQGVRT